MSKFATVASKLFEPGANCSEQTANQNTNIAVEVSKVARERTSGLTVNEIQTMLSQLASNHRGNSQRFRKMRTSRLINLRRFPGQNWILSETPKKTSHV